MKNLIVLVLLIFMPKCYLIGQNDLKFSASVSETVSFDFLKTGNVYLGANAQFGIQFKQLNTSVNYQFGGLYSYNWNDLYDYNFHLLGINCEYRFLSFAKKISPTLGTTLATQIGSNYLNGIFNDGYIPYRGGNPDYVYSNYLGTKFLVSLILGCEFELLKHTFIEIGAGLGVRDIKVKYLSEKIQDTWFVTFDSQLKLSYKFPVE